MITYTVHGDTLKFKCEECGATFQVKDFEFDKQSFISCIRCGWCNEIDDPEDFIEE